MSKISFRVALAGVFIFPLANERWIDADPMEQKSQPRVQPTQVQDVIVELKKFEQGITSGSRFERVEAVYALDKHVRAHAIVVERLLIMLRDHKDPIMRGAAARILALAADHSDMALRKKAAKALIAALDDKEQYPGDTSAWTSPASVRHDAAKGLKSFGALAKPAVDKLGDITAEAKATDLGARVAAAEALGLLGADASATVPKLIKVLYEPLPPRTPVDGHLPFHLKVIETLGAMGEAGGDAVPELMKLLKPDRPERIYAAYALCEMGVAAKPAIPELLKQSEGNDFLHFTTALANLGEVMRPYIIADLESGEKQRQFRALHTLMGMREGGVFALPQLRKTIKSPVRLVRQNSVDAIMRVGQSAEVALPELETAMADDDAWMRYTSAQTIVQLKPDHVGARQLLIKMLDDAKMNKHAMSGLWYVGERATEAIPKLENIIKNSDTYLRTRAAITLWIVHPKSKIAPEVVSEMLQHENYEVRGSAAALVGRVGANAKPILELLRGMLKDENGSVQTWAKGSIEQIEKALK